MNNKIRKKNVNLFLCEADKCSRRTWAYTFYGKPWRDKYTSHAFTGWSRFMDCILIQLSSFARCFFLHIDKLPKWGIAIHDRDFERILRESCLICYRSSCLFQWVWQNHKNSGTAVRHWFICFSHDFFFCGRKSVFVHKIKVSGGPKQHILSIYGLKKRIQKAEESDRCRKTWR